jgi:hypothetical protein
MPLPEMPAARAREFLYERHRFVEARKALVLLHFDVNTFSTSRPTVHFYAMRAVHESDTNQTGSGVFAKVAPIAIRRR